MMHGYWGFPMGFGWFGGIFMFLAWILVFAGVFWLIRGLVMPHRCVRSDETLLDILKKRYAKGEISKEEYEAKRRELGI